MYLSLIMKPGAVLEVLRARQQMGGDVKNSALMGHLKLQQFLEVPEGATQTARYTFVNSWFQFWQLVSRHVL